MQRLMTKIHILIKRTCQVVLDGLGEPDKNIAQPFVPSAVGAAEPTLRIDSTDTNVRIGVPAHISHEFLCCAHLTPFVKGFCLWLVCDIHFTWTPGYSDPLAVFLLVESFCAGHPLVPFDAIWNGIEFG